jgi:hypothetical protein
MQKKLVLFIQIRIAILYTNKFCIKYNKTVIYHLSVDIKTYILIT